MIHVLVANKNRAEGDSWKNSLLRHGYAVTSVCADLSSFVYTLSQEKIHFVMCSSNLIENNAFAVLNAVTKFFPRVKIVIVGGMNYSNASYALRNTNNVITKKSFDTDLDRYLDIAQINDGMESLSAKEQIMILLDEHFLSAEEAARALGRAQPKWSPHFVTICIVFDTYGSQVFKTVQSLLNDLKRGFAYQLRPSEICVILEASPSEELCLSTAEFLHRNLMVQTDVMFSIGVSRPRYTAAELYVCLNEARRAASSQYIYGWNTVVHINWLGESDIIYAYPEHKEKRLVEKVIDGDAEGALTMLDEIFQVLKNRNLRQGLINKIALGILVRLNTAATVRASALDKMQLDTLSLGNLLGAKTIEDVYIFLKNGIKDFAIEMDAFTDLRRDVLYMKLSSLKSKKTDITVSDLIRTFDASINFLNSAVAHNTGGNIFDFFE